MKARTWLLLAGIIAAFGVWQAGAIQVVAVRPPLFLQPTPQAPPVVKRQPPQRDGSVVHVVQQGDTLSTIAYSYGVDVDQIRKLNNLPSNSNTIVIGQKLLIKPAVQPTATPTETSTDVPTPTATPTVAPPTLTPINNKASICVKTFNDANQNRWYDVGEQPLAGIKITLADKSGKGQDIATEAPTCFNDLANGTFIIAAVPPKDYGLTTPPQLQVQVTSGQQLVLEFGAAKGYQPVESSLDKVEATATPPMQAVKPASIPEIVAGNTGLIVLAVAGLLFVGGMSVAFLVRRT